VFSPNPPGHPPPGPPCLSNPSCKLHCSSTVSSSVIYQWDFVLPTGICCKHQYSELQYGYTSLGFEVPAGYRISWGRMPHIRTPVGPFDWFHSTDYIPKMPSKVAQHKDIWNRRKKMTREHENAQDEGKLGAQIEMAQLRIFLPPMLAQGR
jgi:hypothetical protein